MKKFLPFVVFLFFLKEVTCQTSVSPQLKLVGSNFSFAKGNIDEELIVQLIQDKQEQVKQRFFRTGVIKYFVEENGYYKKSQKSFTTFYYIYNVVNTITMGKNKTIVTRNIIKNLMEYTIIQGLASDIYSEYFVKNNNSLELNGEYLKGKIGSSVFLELNKLGNINDRAMPNATKPKPTNGIEWKFYNILCDLVFEMIITDTSANTLKSRGIFDEFDEQSPLNIWNNADNVFRKIAYPEFYGNYSDTAKMGSKTIMKLFEFAIDYYEKFKQSDKGGTDLLDVYKDLDTDPVVSINSITQSQYKAMGKIVKSSMRILRNYTNNTIIANLTSFLLEYTLIEFEHSVNDSSETAQKGILFIDIDGLVSTLYEKYAENYKNSPVRFSANDFHRYLPRFFFLNRNNLQLYVKQK